MLALAARDQMDVLHWGTTHLDRSAPSTVVRFAALHPHKVDGTTEARGAFLIEQRPGALWLITYLLRVHEWGEKDDAPPPPWTDLGALSIHHKYGFFNGHETVDFAMRDGKFVVLAYEYDDDYRDEFAAYIVRDYARHGCPPRCPSLADFRLRRAGIRVIGPASAIDQLVDREQPPLGIDWPTLAIRNHDDAIALWRRLALTRDQADLVEDIPEGPWRLPLATALLRGGNLVCPAARMEPTCQAPARSPALALDDPCARRTLALWALDVIGAADEPVTGLAGVLRGIVRHPAADGALVRAAIGAARHDIDLQEELIVLAWRARPWQRDRLLPEIARYTDDVDFVRKLVGPLDADAAQHADCLSAAVIAAGLDERARKTHQRRPLPSAPTRPTEGGAPEMLRAMCVLASYQALDGKAGDPLASVITPAGLALTWFHYLRHPDDRDRDGDGDPTSRRINETVPASDMTFPDDLVEALGNCRDTTCTAARHVYRFGFTTDPDGRPWLDRLEIRSRPPCAR